MKLWILLAATIASLVLVEVKHNHLREELFSELWGRDGEKWQSNGILQDFSIVGYHKANISIPSWQNIVSVVDYGANGQDSLNDTDAIRRAIRACPQKGVVYLPKGFYVITDTILVKKSNLVIRGAGREKTKIYFPYGLRKHYPKLIKATNPRSRLAIQKKNGLNSSSSDTESFVGDAYTTTWSWSGGFMWFQNCNDVGIEDLTLTFPDTPYLGHFREVGSNGVNFKKVRNGWAKNLTFYNCDSGIFADSCQYLTFKDFIFDQYIGRGNVGGHHGVDFSKSSYCLMEGAVFLNRMIHELGVEHGSHHNVYAACKGVNIHFDHHQTNVHDNLWTDIDLGEGTVVWQTNAKALQHTKSGSTKNEVYWNIKAKSQIVLPDPQLNNIVVGVIGKLPEQVGGNRSWYEIIDPFKLYPQNIHEAQLSFRKRNK